MDQSRDLKASPRALSQYMTLHKKQLRIQHLLEKELERLNRILKTGYELEVHWVPNDESKLHGEVKGTTILIYDQTIKESLKTLRHEFMDYMVCKPIKPYKQVIDAFKLVLNEIVYKEKEQLIESLCRLIDDPEDLFECDQHKHHSATQNHD